MFKAFAAFFAMFVTLFNGTNNLAMAYEVTTAQLNAEANHFANKRRLEMVAEVREVEAELKLIEQA